MTYDEIIEQLEITKSKIKEIARNEYGGESWNDDLDALTEAADIVADYSKATAQPTQIRASVFYLKWDAARPELRSPSQEPHMKKARSRESW